MLSLASGFLSGINWLGTGGGEGEMVIFMTLYVTPGLRHFFPLYFPKMYTFIMNEKIAAFGRLFLVFGLLAFGYNIVILRAKK